MRLMENNFHYYSRQQLLPPDLLPKNLTIRIQPNKAIISQVVLYGCEAWYFGLKKEPPLQ
jgi:hypothetical protein